MPVGTAVRRCPPGTRADEPHPAGAVESRAWSVTLEDYGNRYGVYIQVEGDKNELIAIREGEIPQPGEKVYIHVETEKLHLFDRGTEKSLGYPEMVIRAQEKLAVPKLEKAIAQ